MREDEPAASETHESPLWKTLPTLAGRPIRRSKNAQIIGTGVPAKQLNQLHSGVTVTMVRKFAVALGHLRRRGMAKDPAGDGSHAGRDSSAYGSPWAWHGPHFQPQLERKFPVVTDRTPNRMLGDWLLDYGLYGSEGRYLQRSYRVSCPPAASESPPPSAPPVPDACGQYAPGTYNLHAYQPAGRFWLFQCIESGLFVALAALLLFLAIHQIRRRISQRDLDRRQTATRQRSSRAGGGDSGVRHGTPGLTAGSPAAAADASRRSS